ncbi:MAG: transglycosylase domain-containing protein, partial [FCB group bacterium]|nr:transglycosylase domain-containing protein [FCB group bacterium]
VLRPPRRAARRHREIASVHRAHGNIRGGSTITQQLVRNIEQTGVSVERSLQRKLNEALIAIQLEREFTKDEILELYLNQIFLGISAYGVESASQQYFGKSCRDLTLAQCALLAGLARLPARNQPFYSLENATARRNIVLKQMLEERFITQAAFDAARVEPVAPALAKAPQSSVDPAVPREHVPDRTGYWVEEVRQYLGREKLIPGHKATDDESNPLYEEGLQVHTTIDLRLQQAGETALYTALDKFDERRLNSLKRQKRESEFRPVSGALVCIDNRPEYKGFVRVMVGGRDFTEKKFNNATLARRQPGSSIKPFVWAAAFEIKGLGPDTMEVDEPYYQRDRIGNVWEPKNFGGKFAGPVSLRTALEKSINIVSIKLAERVTVPKLRTYLENVGITQPIDPYAGLTLALGTSTVTVLDQCVAYSVFANGGMRYEPVYIKEIRDRDGIVVYDYRKQQAQDVRRVMPENVAFVMTNLMEGAATYGTGARSRELGRPRAGKTGTTNDARDTWFCGFTPHFTCVVWIGYEDNAPLGNYTGGELAVPIWSEFMTEAHKGLPLDDFTPPANGIEKQSPRGKMTLYTLAGLAPAAPPTPAAQTPEMPAAAPQNDSVSEDALLSTL